jgi:hypothetical protein
MMNHPDVMWRYAETLTRQAELEGRGRGYTAPLLGAVASPTPARRHLRILGFRKS